MTEPKPLTRAELSRFLPDQRSIAAFERLFALIPQDLLMLLARSQEASIDANSAIAYASASNASILNSLTWNRHFTFVSRLRDLPQAIGNAITLKANHAYYFTKTIDLFGNRIVASPNSAILGSSALHCKIQSTGLGATPLISGDYSLVLRDISIEAQTAFDLDATGNPSQVLDWFGVNVINSTSVGTIVNYSSFIASGLRFINSCGLIFNGTFDYVTIDNSLLAGPNIATPIVSIPSTATINRRFKSTNSAFTVPALSTGINVSTSASIPQEGYVLDSCNFSGVGTYTAGVAYNDNKTRWSRNNGIRSSATLGGYYMFANATPTVIAATSTPVKVAGATVTIAANQRFIVTDNRAEYDGILIRNFRVSTTLTLTSGSNNVIGVYAAVNGTVIPESQIIVTANVGGRSENGTLQVTCELEDGDYVEIFVENNTAVTDIVVETLNVIIEALE